MLPLTRSRNRARFFGIPFSPSSLFAAGEQGAWYDPSDYSTLFTDSAGTTPVTGVEQFVGLMLDKSGNGNHAFQTSSAKRPKLAARYNLLTYSEEFDVTTGGWTKNAATVAATGYQDPFGGTSARLMLETSANLEHYVLQAVSITGNQVFSVFVKAEGRTWVQLNRYVSPAAQNRAWFNLVGAGSVGTVTSGVATIQRVANTDWYLCRYEVNVSSGAANATISPATGDNVLSYVGDITKGLYLWGADLRPASQATGLIGPTYQRVAAANVYDTAGFLPYLAFDGLSWAMDIGGSASNLKFLHSDVSSMCAGVTFGQSSDPNAAYALYGSNGASQANIGTAFWYDDRASIPRNNAAVALTTAGGSTVFSAANENTLTPIAQNVIFTANDPANATAASRYALYVNSSAPLSTNAATSALSTANSTFDVQIGSTGNNLLFASMKLYSLIMVNSTLASGQRDATRAWVAGKTGVQL